MPAYPEKSNFLDRQQTARAAGVLLAAGAWDVAPTELNCPDADYVMLYIFYDADNAAAGPGVGLRMELSPDSSADVVNDRWARVTVYDPGAVAFGADTISNIQRDEIQYGAVAVTEEVITYGPIHLGRTVERFRVACAEVGDAANPGSVEVLAVFT